MWLQHWFWFVIWFFCKVTFKIFCFASFFDTSLNHNTIFHFKLLLRKSYDQNFQKMQKKKNKTFFGSFYSFLDKTEFSSQNLFLPVFFLIIVGNQNHQTNKQTKKKTEWIPSNTALRRTHGCTDGQPCIYRTLLAKTGGLKSKVAF